MAEVAEVRQRVLTMVERARQDATERRARARRDEVQARRFIQETATPVVAAGALGAQGRGVFMESLDPGGLGCASGSTSITRTSLIWR